MDYKRQLDRLDDALIDNIINTHDDEILKEALTDYGDKAHLANQVRKIIKKISYFEKILKDNEGYFIRHYKSKNIWRRFLWKLIGYRTFQNIVYDVADVFFHAGLENMLKKL